MVSQPNISDVHLHAGEPLRFKAKFEVAPTFDLAEYQGLAVTYAEPEVADADVMARKDAIRPTGPFDPELPVIALKDKKGRKFIAIYWAGPNPLTKIADLKPERFGISLAPGGTSWAVISDRNAKKDFAAINAIDILEKLSAMPITQWHYNWETAQTTPHIGPMAQDFKHAFYPGSDDKSITTLEADGVAFAAIQGLNQKLEAKNAEIEALKQNMAELKQLVQTLVEKK